MTTDGAAVSSTGLAIQRTEMASERTAEAFERTRLAYERTLLAWIRTATSLISFGFTIYKFFQYVRDNATQPPVHRLLEPRGVALVMIGLGVLGLTVAVIEHHRAMEALMRAHPAHPPVPRSLSMWVAGVLAVLGLVGLVLVIFRQ